MKTAIITDSAANLNKTYLQAHKDLYMLPLLIMVDGESYRDQLEISSEEIYAKLDTHDISTSLPSNEDLYTLLDKLKKDGYTDVLAINLSSGLSGTYNAFNLVFKSYEGLNITHYDSKTLAGGLGFIVEHAVQRVEEGATPEEVVPELDTLRFEDSVAYFTINTLKYLKRGGRIGKVEGTIGEALHMKPVITVNDEGVYVTAKKSIGSLQRALLNMKKQIVHRFKDKQIDLIIHYGDNESKAKDMGEKLKSSLNIRSLTLSQLTPVLGIHTGPGMFAYIAKKA